MPNMTFPVRSERFDGYLAVPEGEGPWPGVVVLHEAFGLDSTIEDQADRLARDGYLALAPDLYSAGPKLTCIRRAMLDLLRGSGRTHADITATRSWLAEHADCTGRVGLVGFCMGGGFALALAGSGEFDAVAANYGIIPRDAARVLAGACPVVASYGKRDLTLRGAAGKLGRRLTELGVVHDVKEYPDSGHSFMTHSIIPTPFGPLAKIVLRAGHVEADANDAWDRLFGFFDEHVKN